MTYIIPVVKQFNFRSIKMTDMELAEESVEIALQYLRGAAQGENTSQYHRNKYRKMIVNEMEFLSQHHPESYVFQEGFIDVDLTLEK